MFYLKEFVKSIFESPLRGLSFVFLSCLLSLGLTHRSLVSKTVERITPEKMASPYFIAVIDNDKNVDKVRKLLSSLPGVLSIDDSESMRSKRKLSALVRQLGSDYNLDSKFMDFKSLKIMLNPTLSSESLDFIRNSVVKIGNKNHISATDIKFPEITSAMNSHPFYLFLKEYGDWGVIAFIVICWIISYWLCYDIIRSRSYIVEKFQRKRYVASKTLATGLGFIFLIFNAFGIWNGTVKVMDSLILFTIISVLWSFSMQDWRWKPAL